MANETPNNKCGDGFSSFDTEFVKREVLDILHEQLGVNETDLEMNKSIQDDLGADSLDCVEIIMACEEEFCITIPEDECERASGTVQGCIDLVCKRLKYEGRLISKD